MSEKHAVDAPEFVPLVLAYSDDGVEIEDIPVFIHAIEKFKSEALDQYKGKKVKLYFLPEEMVNIFIQHQKENS